MVDLPVLPARRPYAARRPSRRSGVNSCRFRDRQELASLVRSRNVLRGSCELAKCASRLLCARETVETVEGQLVPASRAHTMSAPTAGARRRASAGTSPARATRSLARSSRDRPPPPRPFALSPQPTRTGRRRATAARAETGPRVAPARLAWRACPAPCGKHTVLCGTQCGRH